ncbi:MAG: ComEC family competence protein [Caldilineae bacterium]|nr:MAG: ComEC family competence protein [Caldilineae bacterium]
MELPRVRRIPSPFLPVYFALGLAAGIGIAQRLFTQGVFTCEAGAWQPAPAFFLLPLPLCVALSAWGWRHGRRRLVVPGLVATALCLGMWRYGTNPFEACLDKRDLAYYNQEDRYGLSSVLEGVIVGYPERRENYNQYRVRVDYRWSGRMKFPVRGIALVRTAAGRLYRYGDRIRIRGVAATPPVFDDFDYRRYLARKGIRSIVYGAELTLLAEDGGHPFWRVLYGFRARASNILTDAILGPCHLLARYGFPGLQCPSYAALANGMILGIETDIPRELYDRFNLTGTSHVIVISGSNIAIVSGLFLLIFTRLFRRRRGPATLFTLAGIALYTLLVGADAAVTRAAIMGGLYVVALYLGRRSTALISLFIAGLVMLLLNPLTLWDVGFQLSFMATLGLILFSTPLQRRWQRLLGRKLPRIANNLLAEGLLITLAAQITTMPLVVYHFGRLSLISFLANLLILPVQPPIMIAGGLAIFVGLLLLPLAQAIALIPTLSLWWTVLIVEAMAAIPWGSLEVSAFGRLVAMAYTILFIAGFLWWLLRQEQGARSFLPSAWRRPLTFAFTLACIVVIPLWSVATVWENRPDGRLHLHLLGREQGVSFFIVAPDGRRILLEPARDTSTTSAELLRRLFGPLPPLDLVVLTRPGVSASPNGLPAYTAMIEPTHPDLRVGSRILLDEGLSLTLLYRPTQGRDSLLFLLRYGDFTTLVPFENSQETQQTLLPRLPAHPTLLIAPYPGTGAWPHPDLLRALKPQLILLPDGVTYPPSVRKALAAHNPITIPHDADIEIISDGKTLRLLRRTYAHQGARD